MAFLRQYEILLKKAKSDLKAAKNLYHDFQCGDDELDIETVMFHLQQSAEKLLKSLLAYNKLHFTKTHDIEQLINEVNKNNIKIIDDVSFLINLTEYAVEGRYSILHDDLEDVEKYINILDILVEFVKETVH